MSSEQIPSIIQPSLETQIPSHSLKNKLLITTLAIGILVALAGCLFILNNQFNFVELPFDMGLYGNVAWLITGGVATAGASYALCSPCSWSGSEIPGGEDIIPNIDAGPPMLVRNWLSRLNHTVEENFALTQGEAPLGLFLNAYFIAMPERSQAFGTWVDCQNELDPSDGSIDVILEKYRSWKESEAKAPFILLLPSPLNPSIQAILKITPADGISVEELSVLVVKSQALREKPKDIDLQADYKDCATKFKFLTIQTKKLTPTLSKTLQAVASAAGMEHIKKLHWIAQYHLFKQELKSKPDWINDRSYRLWAVTTICYLKQKLDKIPKTVEYSSHITRGIHFLNKTSEEIIKNPLSQTAQIPLSPALKPLSLDQIDFSDSVAFPGQILAEAQGQFSEVSTSKTPAANPGFVEEKETITSIKERHGFLFTLYENGDYTRIDEEITHFLNGLPPKAQRDVLLTNLSSSQKDEMAKQIFEISNLLITNHLILKRTGFHPSRILALLKGLDLLQQIVQKTPENKFEEFSLLTFSILYALKDPYLDLGPFQKEIFATVESLNSSHVGIDFFYFPTSFEMTQQALHMNNDQWYSKWVTKSIEEQTHKLGAQFEMTADFSGTLLPQQLIQLRQLSILISTFLNPHICIEAACQKDKYDTRAKPKRSEIAAHMEQINEALQPGIEKLKADKGLLKLESDIEIKREDDSVGISFNNFHHLLSPCGVPLYDHYYRPYYCQSNHRYADNETFGLPFSPFHTLFPTIRSSEIRNRVVEGIISRQTQPNVDERGFNTGTGVRDARPKPKTDKIKEHLSYKGSDLHDLHLPEGLRHTQRHAQGEKFCFPGLSLEISRDLQLMQGGISNRFSNAIYTFARYPELFSHPQYGDDLSQVFRLNIFHNDHWQREMFAASETFELALQRLEDLINDRAKVQDWSAWVFLYKVHADLTQNLQGSSYGEKISKDHAQHHKILKNKMKNRVRRKLAGACHIAFLYEHSALQNLSEKKVLSLTKSYFFVKNLIEGLALHNPYEHQILQDLGHFLCRIVANHVEKDPSLLDEILSLRFEKPKSPRQWENLGGNVWESGLLKINLLAAEVVYANQLERVLPHDLRTNEQLGAIFTKETLFQPYTFVFVETPVGKLWSTEMSDENGVNYTLYLHRPMLLYRKQGDDWEQLLSLEDPTRSVPFDCIYGFCWQKADDPVVTDAHNQPLYAIKQGEENKRELFRYSEKGQVKVCDPHQMPIFKAIAPTDRFVVTEQPSGCLVQYLDEGFEYRYDKERAQWIASTYPDFHLSKNGLDKWIKSSVAAEKQSPFFLSHFDFYHLLEDDAGHAKLVLGCHPFKKIGGKHSLTINVDHAFKVPPEARGLICFDIQSDGTLQAQDPQNYLFLAYTLFVQGKYNDALLYLRKSQAIWAVHSPGQKLIRELYKSWFIEWPDNTPNGLALKLQLLFLEHAQNEFQIVSEDKILERDALLLPPLFNQAEKYLKEEPSVDALLRLSSEQKETLAYYAPRAHGWVKEKLENSNLDPKAAFLLPEEVKGYFQSNKDEPSKILHWAIDRQIEVLSSRREEVLKKRSGQETNIPPFAGSQPLIDYTPWLSSIVQEKQHGQTKEKIEAYQGELTSVFEGEDSLDADIANVLVADINHHIDAVEKTFTFKDEANPDQCLGLIEKRAQILEVKQKQLKKELLGFFPLSELTSSSIERQLKEQEGTFEDVFNQAEFCFGIQDYSLLIFQKILTTEQIQPFDQKLREYLTVKGDRKLLLRQAAKIEEMKKEPADPLLRRECARMLSEWRNYDTSNHPYAHLFLLIEDKLNVNLRDLQVTHVDNLIKYPDAYLHEAMAGGKTALLRHIFAAIQAQKGYLGSVMTYSPLMAMHTIDFSSTNRNVFGSGAYPFYFSRQSARDTASIKMMIVHHLTALTQNGRLDQTPASALSLKHTLRELIINLQELPPEDLKTDLYPAILSLQRLLRLRGDDLSSYADEIDKIFDPLLDHNYSCGEKKILEKKYYKPALSLLELIQTEKELAEFCQVLRNPTKKMGSEEFEEGLQILGAKVFDRLGLNLDKKKTIAYLTEQHQKDEKKQQEIIDFYNTSIMTLDDPDVIIELQVFHGLIGIVMRSLHKKTPGVNYGRSNDGVSVKPYAFSAKCREASQRSFALTTVMEACFDYLAYGVTEAGIEVYCSKVRRSAEEEHQKGDGLAIDETESGIAFQEQFGISLSKVTRSDFARMKEVIEKDPHLLNLTLESIFFKDFSYYTSKIEGYPHHLLLQNAYFTGASGSPERVHTLPSAIKKPAETIRQKGAIGSVFYALLSDFDETRDLIALEEGSVAKQMAELLNPGDTLVDNAPFFPGMSGLQIAQAINPHTKESSDYRLLDEEESVFVWDGKKAQRERAGLNLKSVRNVIDHKGKQGTDWKFASGTKGIVEIDPETDLTSFGQSLLRLRLLGKGQTARILYHLLTIEGHSSKISLFTRLTVAMIRKEAALQRQLNTEANVKDIKTTYEAGIETLSLCLKSREGLVWLRNCPEAQLEKKSLFDPAAFGAPVELTNGREQLERLKESYLDKLIALRHAAENSPLSGEEKNLVFQTLNEIEKNLNDPTLILDEKLLADKRPKLHFNSDASEEIEVEEEAQTEVEAASSGEDLMEDQGLSEIEAEKEAADPFALQIQPTCIDSEFYNYTNSTFEGSFHPSPWTFPFGPCLMNEIESRKTYTFYMSPDYFPHVWASKNTLCLDPKIENTLKQEDLVPHFWWNEKCERQAILSPKVFIALDTYYKVAGCQFMSENEMDIYGDKILLNSCEGPNASIGTGLHVGTYKKLFRLDLRESHLPKELQDEPLRDKIIELLAYAKMVYLEGNFSEKEKSVVKNWLGRHKESLPLLIERLSRYLEQHYPNKGSHPLLGMMKEFSLNA